MARKPEGGPTGGAAELSLIDPVVLGGVINDLATMEAAIISETKGLKAEFDLIGVPAGAVKELTKVAAWLHGELPMLRRRQAAAVLLASQRMALPPGITMQSVPEDPAQAFTLAGELAAQRLLELKVDDPGSRERAMELAAFLAQYGKDPAVANKVMQTLGPEGLQKAMRTLRSLTATQPPYFVGVKDPSGEHKAVLALQDQMAGSLALVLSTASKNLNQDWGSRFAHDTWTAGVLLRYADKQNLSFGRDFYRGVGHALKDREQGDPLAWDFVARDPDNASFGTESFTGSNPMREYLNTADNSAETSQGALGDQELVKYFLADRRYQDKDGLEEQTAKVLRLATIQAATSMNDAEAKAAAGISSQVLWMTGDKAHLPRASFKDEVADVLSLYMMDADRAVSGQNYDDPGVIDPMEYRLGFGPDDHLPRFGAKLDREHLYEVLGYLSDDEALIKKVGEAATLYNQVRLDSGAKAGNEEVFLKRVRESSQLASTLQLGLVNVKIGDVEQEARVGRLFTAPLDQLNSWHPVGEIINDGIIGAARDEYYDHKLQKVIEAENTEDRKQANYTKFQALYALAKSEHPPAGLPDWPRNEHGVPKSPNQLSEGEAGKLINQMDNRDDLTDKTVAEVEDAWRSTDPRFEK